ncbi:hypothetical protein ROZALSC1DRAFT_30899 [Rozella allomycis CSF55]|uniref:Hypervirulence associated protein TUDOR domain-containing protein n=1 Tax=Rozella allomycis (strain CSF55) TaxID=988480 RepID=A0A075AR91_ROZAC|nr:hypothetical protein O9G_005201 [Rozella allomycis CSF55]RKP17270.1 hypothetical protein ROZALSC1DRAFT_30899 [Rozella allomycis CSF55]|eukprot:EPZ31231.1 hypothetical protein O9G_005201 [Rozella allomycis CSF55]
MTARKYHKGDHVEYHPVGGEHNMEDHFGRKIHASKDEPRYMILNDHTQKETAYKESNIVRVIEDEE